MRGAKDSLAREIATAAAALAGLFFMLGVACGTSKELGMLLLWILAGICVLIALIAGARAVLLDHFPPPE